MKQVLDIPRTAMEVFNMLPEGTRCEVIDNTIYMSPSPTSTHQEILGNIYTDLNVFIRQHQLGKVFINPLDVYLSNEADVVQPDLLFVSTANLFKVQNKGIIGAPDLVLEILSSNSNHDTKVKFDLYQSNGIDQYIIIEPNTKAVWHYKLIGNEYEQLPTQNGILKLHTLNLTIEF